jgi:hypothetical protein
LEHIELEHVCRMPVAWPLEYKSSLLFCLKGSIPEAFLWFPLISFKFLAWTPSLPDMITETIPDLGLSSVIQGLQEPTWPEPAGTCLRDVKMSEDERSQYEKRWGHVFPVLF